MFWFSYPFLPHTVVHKPKSHPHTTVFSFSLKLSSRPGSLVNSHHLKAFLASACMGEGFPGTSPACFTRPRAVGMSVVFHFLEPRSCGRDLSNSLSRLFVQLDFALLCQLTQLFIPMWSWERPSDLESMQPLPPIFGYTAPQTWGCAGNWAPGRRQCRGRFSVRTDTCVHAPHTCFQEVMGRCT